ncbi:MAG: hypothetical protein HYZ46_04990 [Nitrosomonadales bacterium]|nr:hypothetical protein [Nitrosomonadales bacterium]
MFVRAMSRIGLVLCVLYVLIIAACFTMAFSSGTDLKGQFVFMQLPIAIQGALLQALGLGSFLGQLSWVLAYMLIVPSTFVLLYFAGWLIDGGDVVE